MAQDIGDDNQQASAPFEGPEKLLEIWFAPSAADVPDAHISNHGRFGLRNVDRNVWEDMLSIVQCKVLSVIQGEEMDAYLLSESSFFVSPHRLILKTCGTTLNLFGLPRILEIASQQAGLHSVYRCFYSRKSFMFPERQLGPHRDWKKEVEYLDNIFDNGAAYTVGKVNGDHWLLYITAPSVSPIHRPTMTGAAEDGSPDYTIEILMSDLSPSARAAFFTPEDDPKTPAARAQLVSESLGITDIFPPQLTTLDAYAFTPCGFSSNAVIRWGEKNATKNNATKTNGYYTIHVTPEEGWSYASFECNVPLSTKSSPSASIPDLQTLIQRVVSIFQPGRLSLTLFISNKDNDTDDDEAAVDAAQKAFRTALSEPSLGSDPYRVGSNGKASRRSYKRTDKINYEFNGYDLAFASFELRQ
ncbi:S-adenosylmethionine decarboxylase [Infundibulicybe gibba]|nr:S-adenosylmethionine decarboxylase [Infundibulicybe gibba]